MISALRLDITDGEVHDPDELDSGDPTSKSSCDPMSVSSDADNNDPDDWEP